jgi:hypothetical protein
VSSTFLYKPPTYIVTREQPYLTLVTAVDPRWAHDKFREVQYEFAGRTIYHNPYWGAVYSGYSNEYNVGMQWGLIDPAFQPPQGVSLGAVAQTNASSLSVTTPADVPAGSAIVILAADTSASNFLPANLVSDSNQDPYEIILSGLIGKTGAPWSIFATLTTEDMPQGSVITYESPGTPSASNAVAFAAVAITGGVRPQVFDPAVTQWNALGSGSSNVQSGNPSNPGQVFIGFAVAGSVAPFPGDSTDTWSGQEEPLVGIQSQFSGDSTNNWTNLQQAAVAAANPLALCSETLNVNLFDPGTNNSVGFAPGGGAPWTAIVVGVMGNKPMMSGINDNLTGWA